MNLAIKAPRLYWLAAIGGAVALAALAFGFGYARFASDVQRATQRVAHGSRIAATQCGPIEYAEMGEGPAVLLVHGAGGGFDQAIEFGGELARRGYRIIAMSRFGYLRTPLPADATPQAQADAHACLLDALGIQRAAIAGVSAGAPSSLQFAIRYPERTSALALLVPLAYMPRESPPAPPSRLARFMYERAVKSDLLYWLAMRMAPGVVVKTILATPPEVVAHASIDERRRVAALMEHILPLKRRQAGLLNDAHVAQTLSPSPLEQVKARTLVISLADDLYGTFASARYTASQIHGARFVGYESGGHVWVGHHGAVLDELLTLLSNGGNEKGAV